MINRKTTITKFLPKRIKGLIVEHNRIKKNSNEYKANELTNPGNYYSLNAFDYYKCIFVHVPKAAGISINKALFGNYVGSHKTIREYKKIYPKRTFDRYFKFTIVRNPWDRLHSAYTFLKKGGMNKFDYDFMKKELNHINSFEQFVMEWLNENTINSYVHFKPQLYFLLDEKGNCPLDFIARFENLNNDFITISKRINNKAQLKHLNNTSRQTHYKDIYTEEMIQKVGLVYKNDIEFFKYSY